MIKKPLQAVRPPVAAAFLLLAAGTSATAQTAPTAAADTATTEASVSDDVIVLSPFTVSSENAARYRATDTLAGSRIRTELKDVGSAISVVTADFLRDTGSRNNQDLLVYTTGTEVGGVGGNFAGLGNGQFLDDTGARMNPNQNTRVRGLDAADNTRDFFLTDIAWDSFNVGRVDLQRGPNAMLFGMGSPAGIINASLNSADLTNKNTVEFRLGSYGSMRGTLDLNRMLLDDELALRVSALDDNTKYRQDPAFNHDKRLYAAFRYDPKFLRFEGARTSIKANYEKGTIRANRPRSLPPGDLITPWFTDPTLQGVVLDPRTVGQTNVALVTAAHDAGDLGMGARQSSLDGGVYNPNYNARIGSFGRNYGGIVAAFADENGGGFNLFRTDISTIGGLKSDGSRDQGIGGIPWTIMSGVIPFKDYVGNARNADGSAKYPDAGYGLYKNYVLTDSSVFDFYNKLLDGPNKREWSNHEAFNIGISQTFFNNRLGVEAVYDHQNYDRGQENMMSDYGQSITLDMNMYNVDGVPNPNFGRACVVSDGFANNTYKSERDSTRVTAFGELRADDFLAKGFLSKLLGRHVVTGVYSKETADIELRNWFNYAADASYGATVYDPLLRNRGINILSYFGPSLAGRTTASGANLPNLTARQIPTSGLLHWFDSTWNSTVSPGDVWTDQYGNPSTQSENPANYVGWVDRPIDVISQAEGERDSLTTNASLRRSKVSSKAVSLQSYFWDGTLVGTVGVRKDTAKDYSLNQGPKSASGDETIDLASPDYRLPDEPGQIVKGTSRSYSVVLHTPKEIRRNLPGNTDLTLIFNKSENFQPAAGRADALGNSIAPPKGKTREYGFAISTLDDKVSLKVTWYKTTVSNAALSGFSGDYMLPAAEAWGYMFGRQAKERLNAYGTSNSGLGGYTPKDPSETVAHAIAAGDAIVDAFLANQAPDEWYSSWGIDRSQYKGWMNWTTPQGFTVTGDTMSKGTEFELNIAPVKNLNISINASKTSAQRTNMAESMAVWVESRWALYNTPVMIGSEQVGVIGDVRLWGPDWGGGNETVRGKFGREFMAPYRLYRMQENSNVPELRPWRANIVVNYSFDEGFLKGVNIGGGYRWQDGSVLGYKLKDGATAEDPKVYDLENPYMGKAETNVDLWVGYGRKLTEKIDWRIQLNLRNLTTKKGLIPVTVQPDGTMAVGRISDPMTWSVTNTFTF